MNIHKYLFLFLLTMLSITASAQENQVADAVESFRKGIEMADQTLLTSIAADQLVYGHSNGKVQNKAEFITEIVSKTPIIYSNIVLSEQQIKISGTTAVVRHIFSADIENSGKPGKLKIGNMLIWQKQGGKWKLLARQAYKI